eukprot:CAMPEP_0114503138 /NCGR_PEP_ID=MMETSP0109-20121206/9483_1 /TAXON_ID=29199 /ORGANISM="Chlorarachnion reptans, Strain CCCM449" /LENGTH=518 /DNA_ID=CAMNT_0001681137 /DNA_START=16 /DNA_END=1572 /DNA_ORIENTATION=+
MFFSQYIVVKKGPLNKVWLAAHIQKKLTKNFVLEINIADHVKTLLDPTTALALRLSGQLLLGLVNIYSKKTQFLERDCNDAMASFKIVFTTQTAVDLPQGAQAPRSAITLQETNFDDFDFEIEEVSLEDLDLLKHNVARKLDITQESKLSRRKDESVSESDIEQPRQAENKIAEDDFGINIREEGDLLDFDDPNSTFGPGGDSTALDFDNNISIPEKDDLDFDNGMELPDIADKILEKEEKEEEEDLDINFDLDLEEEKEEEVKVVTVKKSRKRRRQQLDSEVEISSKQIKKQLADTTNLRCERKLDEQISNAKQARSTPQGAFFDLYLSESLSPALVSAITKKIKKCIQDKLQNVGAEEQEAEEKENREPEDLGNQEVDEEFPLDQDPFMDQSMNDTGFADTSIEPMEPQPVEGADEKVYPNDNEEEGGLRIDEATEKKANRAVRMYKFLKEKMEKKRRITFRQLLGSASRKAAAGVFHELLVLKTRGLVNVIQKESYGQIHIEKSSTFTEGIVESQ